MPRKYARKSNRNSWDEAAVTRAIAATESGEPLKSASKLFGVPRTTLKAVSHITGWPKRRGNGDPKMSLRWCSLMFVGVRFVSSVCVCHTGLIRSFPVVVIARKCCHTSPGCTNRGGTETQNATPLVFV